MTQVIKALCCESNMGHVTWQLATSSSLINCLGDATATATCIDDCNLWQHSHDVLLQTEDRTLKEQAHKTGTQVCQH